MQSGKEIQQTDDETSTEDSEEDVAVSEDTDSKVKGVGKTIQTVIGPMFEYEATIENVPLHPSIVSFGKRRSGKSTSMDNWMMHCLKHLPFGIVMTRTKMNGFWQQRVPERFVFQLSNSFREDILLALIDRQKKLIEKWGKENPKTFAFIVLDDVIADQKQIRYTPALNSFFVEGRHMNITILITSQYIKGIGPMLRGNCDLIFVQPIYNVNERQALWELYAGFMEKKDWFALMDQVVFAKRLEGHTPLAPNLEVQILVIQDFEQTAEPTEKFFWWKPLHSDALPNYKLLHPIYWKEVRTGRGEVGKSKGAHPADVLQKCRSVLTAAPSVHMFNQ